MLANIAGRADDLCFADVVVGQVDYLEGIADVLVIVDNITHLVDEMNHCLGHPVTWCGLTTEDGHARS